MSQIFQDPQFVRKVQRLDNILADVKEKMNHKVKQCQAMNNFKQKFRKHQPKNLMGGNLKPYQHQALVWMIELAFREMNGILADDMGLGKTIQTIAYLAYLKQEHGIKGKHLIIAPLTVLNNWERQIKKWLPSLKVAILWATVDKRQQILRNIVKTRDFDILITSYQGAVVAVSTLKNLTWETMTIDQAHKIKNDESVVSESVKKYKANFKLLLTGTPLSNNLCELWSLLSFVMPDIFYDKTVFLEVQQGVKFSGMSQQEQFQAQCQIAKRFHGIIKPFVLRRTKANTDLGLPPKTIKTLFVAMTKLQLKMYKNFLKYKSVYGKDCSQQYNGQMTTRKICNHPYLYPEIESQDSPQYGEHIIDSCGKMLVLDKLLKKLVGIQKKKVLLFSQFKIQLDILEDFCTYRNYNYLRLDGDSSIEQRQQMMNDFNNDKHFQIPIFMLSTRAGGLGINLVAASIVIIYDIDWNPQIDNQAMDRAYRIGQVNPVHVFKLVTQHTIEERMLEVQKYKMVLDQLVIQKGTVINLKNQDIMAGLNYDKIVNMKKGDVFKLEAHQDNRTIEQIIAMGEVKDQQKLEEIKKKINKQIQSQKDRQGSFNANPFDQNQLIDQQGNAILKQYHGMQVRNKIVPKPKHVQYKRNNQISITVRFYHLYSDVQSFIQKSKRIVKLKQQLENDYNGQQKQKITQLMNLQNEVQKMNENAHTNWTFEEFKKFVRIQKASINQTQDNIDQLKKQIPHKSVRQIKAYKTAYYKYQSTNVDFKRQRLLIAKCQQNNNAERKKQMYMKSLQQNQIKFYNKLQSPLLNHLNNLKISSGLLSKKEFQQSQCFKKDKISNFMKGFVNFQHTVQKQKGKLLAYTQLQSKFGIKEGAQDNPQVDKVKYEEKYIKEKSTILANLRKKYFSGKGDQQQKQDNEKPQQIEI